MARELTGVLEELREIARGIHPAVLAQAGLRPALKALTTAAKHAEASAVHIEVHEDGGALRAPVQDDGRGGAHFADGAGLVGLRDRVEAIGGRLSLHADGPGTVVEVELPLAPVDAIAG